MGMIDRYKKSGGFIQLLTLIETSPISKQQKFLELIKQENPAWEEAINIRILSLEKIFSWPADAIMEITGRVQPLYLAAIAQSSSQDIINKLYTGVPSLVKKQIDELLSYKSFTPGEVNSCKEKFIQETRNLINTGILKTDKFDPKMTIPDEIEEKLNNVSAFAKGPINEELPITPLKVVPEPATTQSTNIGSPQIQVLQDEIAFLKKKLSAANQELVTTKQELAIYKDKLDKIRKIA